MLLLVALPLLLAALAFAMPAAAAAPAGAAARRGGPRRRAGLAGGRAAGAGPGRLAGRRRGRPGGPAPRQHALPGLRRLRPGLPGAPPGPRQPRLRGRAAGAAGGHLGGGHGAAPRPALGGHRDHHPGHGAAHLLQPQPSGPSRRPGSTWWSARSASPWRSSAPSCWRSPPRGPAGRARCCWATCWRPGRSCRAPGSASPSVFLLVGYGTKLGLAPFHAWKPDAYGEAPGLLGALLSGGVTSVAFLALAARAAGLRRRRGGGLRAPARWWPSACSPSAWPPSSWSGSAT